MTDKTDYYSLPEFPSAYYELPEEYANDGRIIEVFDIEQMREYALLTVKKYIKDKAYRTMINYGLSRPYLNELFSGWGNWDIKYE